MKRGWRGFALVMAGLLASAAPATARTILFVGNSFTYGQGSAVRAWHGDRVADLNREGNGGVPALFEAFAREAGQDWQVSLETSPGRDLAWHLDNRLALIARRWDVVVLQGYSTLDAARPGDSTRHIAAAARLATALRQANPAVRIWLVSTWTRADQTFLPQGHWYGQPVMRMAEDIAAANRQALATVPGLAGAIPVGTAWNRAMATGVADPDPYDGREFGKVDLWSWDQYHASAEGSYLAALTEFATITGADPRVLGGNEAAAHELGIDPRVVARLQAVAAAECRPEVSGAGARGQFQAETGAPHGPTSASPAALRLAGTVLTSTAPSGARRSSTVTH